MVVELKLILRALKMLNMKLLQGPDVIETGGISVLLWLVILRSGASTILFKSGIIWPLLLWGIVQHKQVVLRLPLIGQ